MDITLIFTYLHWLYNPFSRYPRRFNSGIMPGSIKKDKSEYPDTVIDTTLLTEHTSPSARKLRDNIELSNEQFAQLLKRISGPSAQTNPPTALGNPGPLGLSSFALSIFMFSVFNAGSNLIDARLLPVVYPAAIFYGGIAQFAAGMWKLRINNTFGALVFGSFGTFWIGLAVHFYLIVPLITDVDKTNLGTGFYLFS